MPRGNYRVNITCAGPLCRETQTYRCATRAEEAEVRQMQARSPWKCERHDRPERYMQPGNESTRHVMVAAAGRDTVGRLAGAGHEPPSSLFWYPEDGGKGGGWGLLNGPGFVARASEFPEGTRLVVAAHVEIPASCSARSTQEPTQ